jgi:hypothetical protein
MDSVSWLRAITSHFSGCLPNVHLTVEEAQDDSETACSYYIEEYISIISTQSCGELGIT